MRKQKDLISVIGVQLKARLCVVTLFMLVSCVEKTALLPLSKFSVPGEVSWFNEIEYNEANLFVVTNTGFLIIDANDPLQPQIVGQYSTNEFTGTGFAVNNNLVLISKHNSNEIEIVDVSDPHHPERISAIPIKRPVEIETQGELAFINEPDSFNECSYCSTLSILDISDPLKIKQVSILRNVGAVVEIYGNRIFTLTDGLNGRRDEFQLSVIDVTNPSGPVILIQSIFNHPIYDVAVNNEMIFLAGEGIRITRIKGQQFDIIGQLPVTETNYIDRILVENDHAYILSYEGVLIVDISDPTQPMIIDSSSPMAQARDMLFSQGFLFITDVFEGLLIMRVRE